MAVCCSFVTWRLLNDYTMIRQWAKSLQLNKSSQNVCSSPSMSNSGHHAYVSISTLHCCSNRVYKAVAQFYTAVTLQRGKWATNVMNSIE